MTCICTGILGRNCVAAAFALSLVLVVVGLIDSIPLVFYLKAAAESLFNSRKEPQDNEPAEEVKVKPKSDDDDLGEEDPEKQQCHKGVMQNWSFYSKNSLLTTDRILN